MYCFSFHQNLKLRQIESLLAPSSFTSDKEKHIHAKEAPSLTTKLYKVIMKSSQLRNKFLKRKTFMT